MGLHQDPRSQMLASLQALVSLCVRPANRLLSRKSRTREDILDHPSDHSPRQLLTKISNKAVPSRLKRRKLTRGKEEEEEGKFGVGGLWQKGILMGVKCQPPEFSGVIYYDYDGKRLSEPPRSPRPSPLPRFYSSQAKDGI